VVTTTELTTILNPEFLFEFIHEQSQQKYYCILDNISDGIPRYDEYILVDGVDVIFDYDGDYIYNIFQQTSPTNLDPLLSDGLVETGRAKVLDLPVESNEFEQEIIFNIYE
jgi:hypothetical protein